MIAQIDKGRWIIYVYMIVACPILIDAMNLPNNSI